jgi:hypothetical protein
VSARPRDLEAVQEQIVLPDPAQRRKLELRSCAAVLAGQHHVHRRPVGPGGGEHPLRDAHQLRLGLADFVVLEHGPDSVLVDPEALAHRLQLLLALHSPGKVEALVPGDGDVGDRAEVTHRHDVVEAVDADPLEAAIRDPLARVLGEDLVVDPRLRVVADPARLFREDDGRLALGREDDVRVAVEDPEAGEVAHRALEARVLGAGDDHRVEPVARGRLAHVGVPALDLLLARHLQVSSNPWISCVSARLSGVSTPWRSPKATIAPFRKSISVARRASTSWSMLGLWP